MTGAITLRNTPDAKFFGSFARAVIPPRMARFPDADGCCHFCGHGWINTKRPAHWHFGKWIFGPAAVPSGASLGNGDVGVYAHVRLLLLRNVCRIVLYIASVLFGLVPRDAARDTFRDAPGRSGRGTPGRTRDTWGVYIYDISPVSRRRVCAGSACPGRSAGEVDGGAPMTTPAAVAVLALGAVAAGALGFALGYAWGWLWW